MKYFLLFLILVSITALKGYAYQQNTKIDSLIKEIKKYQEIKKHQPDTNILKIFIELSDEYNNISTDSSNKYNLMCVYLSDIVFYNSNNPVVKTTAFRLKAIALRNIGINYTIQSNLDKAMEYYFHSLRTYSIIDDKKGKACMFRYIGIAYYYKGSYDIALKYYKYAMNFAIATLDTVQLSNIYSNIGIIYHRQGDYKKGLEFYIKQMKLLEHTKDQKGLSACYINLGNLYKDQKNDKEAIRYYNLALSIKQEINDQQGVANIISNLGGVYYKMMNYEKAISHFMKALPIYESLNDKIGLSNCYANIGAIYAKQKMYEQALKYYLKSEAIDQKVGNAIENLYNIGGLANIYIILSDTSTSPAQKRMYAQKALEYAKRLELLSKKSNIWTQLEESYDYLRKASKRLGNYKNAIYYAEKEMELDDSLISERSAKVLAEMQTKYETEKKQLQIEKLNKENELKEIQLEKNELLQKRQKTIIFSILSIFLIVFVFSFFLTRLYVQLKKSHQILKEHQHEIELKNEELKTANEEILVQKEEIEVINKKLTDSIEYASNIQQAVLPESSYMIENLRNLFDLFILFKPKDIVSGDFYWFTKMDNIYLFTVADCTGHGVPGAFMSMLGISLLNEIVRKKEITSASQVLEELRKEVIHSLHQNGKLGEQKDGMDIAFIAIDTLKHELQFAGANNPIYIYQNAEIKKINGDKMPIGIYERMQPFTNNIININTGDIIYLSSDGIKDQFGGSQGKKFLSKQLEKVLLNNSQENMNTQKNALLKALNDWQNNGNHIYEQTDDITVIGIKILF